MGDFTQELVEVLKGMAGLDIQVILTEVTKANGQTSSAICLLRPEHNVSRLFYPGEYYGAYCRGRSVKEIAGEILETFQNDAVRAELELRLGILNPFDFTKAKRQLYCRLINFDRSRNYLKNKCFIQWLDFAVCFYIMVESRNSRHTIADVTIELQNAWKVSKNELFQVALENLCNDYPAKIEGLGSVIEHQIRSAEHPDEFAEFLNPPEFSAGKSMHVLTNAMCSDSAIALCYPDVLKNFAESQGAEEVILFPSSVHEIILVPKQEGLELDAGWCGQLVKEINAAKVPPEEVLSDHAYLYSRKSNEIKIFE